MTALDGRFGLGLFLSVLSCFLSAVGFTMQRKSQLLLEEERRLGGTRGYRALWGVGVVIYIVAAIPDVLSYLLVPQVVCTTVACFRLVVISIMASTFLAERLGNREVLGMLACTAGTFFCLVFGPRRDQSLVAEGLPDGLQVKVWIYLGIGAALLCCLLATEHAHTIERYKSHQRLHFFILPLATALGFALGKICNTELGFMPVPTSVTIVLETPALLGLMVSMAALGLTVFYLNLRGAARMPVQVFVSTEFALEATIQFIQSFAILDEFLNLAPLHTWLSASGALISLAGALLIQPPKLRGEPCKTQGGEERGGKAAGPSIELIS